LCKCSRQNSSQHRVQEPRRIGYILFPHNSRSIQSQSVGLVVVLNVGFDVVEIGQARCDVSQHVNVVQRRYTCACCCELDAEGRRVNVCVCPRCSPQIHRCA